MEAYRVLQEHAQAQRFDVRSRAELDWVGHISGTTEIELRSYPGMQPNPHFFDQLTNQVNKSLPVLIICRSGARSNQAAAMPTDMDFAECYNILEGFEGNRAENDQRDNASG